MTNHLIAVAAADFELRVSALLTNVHSSKAWPKEIVRDVFYIMYQNSLYIIGSFATLPFISTHLNTSQHMEPGAEVRQL